MSEQSYLQMVLTQYDLPFLKPQNLHQFTNDQPTQQYQRQYQYNSYFSITYGVETEEYLQFQISTSVKDDLSYKCGVDLLFMIDRSQTMTKEMLMSVKESLKQILLHLRENDRISLIQYNENADRLLPFIHVTKANLEIILGIIESISPRGYCSLIPALLLADCCLKYRKYQNQPTALYIFTNGKDFTRGQLNIKHLLTYNRMLSIHIYGLGYQDRQHLLNHFKQLHKGICRYVDNLSELPKLLLLNLAITQQIVVCNLNITIKCKQQNRIQFDGVYGGCFTYISDSELMISKNSISISYNKSQLVKIKKSLNQLKKEPVCEVQISFNDVFSNTKQDLIFPIQQIGYHNSEGSILVQEYRYKAEVEIKEAIDYYDPNRIFDSLYILDKYLKEVDTLPDGIKQEINNEITLVQEVRDSLEKHPNNKIINPFDEEKNNDLSDLQKEYLEQYLFMQQK